MDNIFVINVSAPGLEQFITAKDVNVKCSKVRIWEGNLGSESNDYYKNYLPCTYTFPQLYKS